MLSREKGICGLEVRKKPRLVSYNTMNFKEIFLKNKEFSTAIDNPKLSKSEDTSHKAYPIHDLVDWQLQNVRRGFLTLNVPFESIEIEVLFFIIWS